MKAKKILACLMAGAMALSLVACGNGTEQTGGEPTTESSSTTPETDVTEPEPTTEEASIDFEDGNMGFMAAYTQPADAAEVEMSVVDYNGSKALQVKNLTGKVPYVAVDATTLLGADVAKVASVELTVGVSYDDGSFNAVSGNLFAWSGADLVESKDSWSVYLDTANPKKAVATLAAGEEFVADAGNIFMLQLKTDNGATDGHGNATLYIDNIRFLDASGNLLKADSSVAFVGPEIFHGSGVDYSNLCALTGAVAGEGLVGAAGGWTQVGAAMSEDFLAALVPGSVVEIEYTSETGNMWIVMNEAAGWSRVGVGDLDGSGSSPAYTNNSGTICQITYEQLAEKCGEDVSTWGSTMQFESDGEWEVFSVKVGQRAPRYTAAGAVEGEGMAAAGAGWSQAGAAMSEDFLAALVPGSVVEIEYTSESGNLWIVMNEAAAGWSRVGVGNFDGSGSSYAVCDGSKCYVTYEQLAEKCGEDVSTWGSTMQFESDTAWEVYSVKVGTAAPFKMVNNQVEFVGAAASAGAWTQAGAAMTPEFLAALVPGSVVTIEYTSEFGDLWIVMNEAAAGWSRVGVGNFDGSGSSYAACDGSICQITYEQLAEKCGEDVSTWGSTMQFESSGAWEVFKVTVGQSAE